MRENNRMKTTSGQGSGFTLIELMLVVAVIAILMAMAIPAFYNTRKHANEISAIASLRSISTSENVYRIRFGTYASLPDLIAANCMDDSYADTVKSGYIFMTEGLPNKINWAMNARPAVPGVSGDRCFFIDDSGVIRYKDGVPAGPADEPVD